jgi:uncharacterized membrane protein
MSTPVRESTLEERITRLELRVGEGITELDGRADRLDARLRGVEVMLLRRSEAAAVPATTGKPASRAAVSPESRCDLRRSSKDWSSFGRRSGAATHAASRPRAAYLPVLEPDRVSVRVAFGASSAGGPWLGDVLGGRVLAWIGGAATLLGIVLFLSLAISHGWIGEGARSGAWPPRR